MMPSILTDGKDALAVFDAVADISAGGHRGFLQHFVTVTPVLANGVTVTGTQTEES